MKLWHLAAALVALEAATVILFLSDAENWDCGGQCSAYSRSLVALYVWVIPGCLVVVLAIALARALRRRGA